MDRFDVLFLLGLVMVGWGLYLVYPPLALIVPGVVLGVVGLVGASSRAASARGGEG
jgi:hypothetical protein